jgi:outer membrane protein assembly factor BamB
MSVDSLIDELQRRRLVSQRVMDKLREKVTTSNRPLSASALAKFLVKKQHLSQHQATDVLNALRVDGVDVDAVGSAPPVAEAPAVLSQSEVVADTEEDPDDSSIFAPYLAGGKKSGKHPAQSDDDDDLALVALDDDASAKDVDGEENDDGYPRRGDKLERSEMDPLVGPSNFYETSGRTIEDKATAEFKDSELADPDSTKRSTRKGKRAPRRSKPTIRKKQWDSPLMLYGGGGLALMLLIGAAVYWLLFWDKGNQVLLQAREAINSGAYPKAIEHYEQFLLDSPRHPQASAARVQLGMARIRQATESANYEEALKVTQTELEAIEDEKQFENAQAELTALLPQIASGLAQQAEKSSAGDGRVQELVEQAKTALELCGNVAYIPQKSRDEGQLNVVRELIQRIERRELSHQALQATLTEMQQAINSGKMLEAYAAHRRLIKERPELAGDPKLGELVQRTTAAEQAAIRFVSEEQASETSERPTPWLASLTLAQRRGKRAPAAAEAASGPVACVRVDGAVYGLEAATGRLLWRRHVGHSSTAWPVLSGENVLVGDVRNRELLRLDAGSGKLVWRQNIGEQFAPPLVVGKRIFLSAASGRLYVIDLASGTRAGYLQFAQPLVVPPATDRRQERLYLTGEHFSLYSISLADLACLGVYYLGHDAGSIQFPPAQLLNKLAVLENDGVETSQLHLVSLDDGGAVKQRETTRRLPGLAASPLLVDGRRLLIATDRGRFDVYEVGAGQGGEALTELATRAATDSQPIVRYVAVADGHIWVGDTQLTKYKILPTGNRLPVVGIENNFAGAAFDHPLEVFGKALIHVRRPSKRAGWAVAATDMNQGRTLWETDLAVPPAWSPIVDAPAKAFVVANANGFMFRFDEAAIRSRIVDEPLAAQTMPAPLPPLTAGADLGKGRAAFLAADSRHLLLYDAAAGASPIRWIELESPLACTVTPFGTGLLAPLQVGQVFYLNSTDGKSMAMPFQPPLQPRSTVAYQPAGTGAAIDRRFVITDGQEKIYLVGLVDQPQPRLEAVTEAKVSPYRIVSPVIVLGDLALAATDGGHLVRYRLPSLEPAGEADLPGEISWGPFVAGEQALLATADEKLVGVSSQGDIAWTMPLEHGGELAGPPLAVNGEVLLAYRKGFVERRALANGKVLAKSDVEHPLAAGPVQFLGHVVLTANDGTLLVVDQP